MNTNTQKTVSSASAIRSFRGKYAFLSNMYECPIEFGGLQFSSAEAAFQAQKTLNLAQRKNFCALNPQGAKKFGKSKSIQLRPDWEIAKLGIMLDVVREKFYQNPELKDLLLATGDAELVEGNTWGDTYWGVDSREGGENKLGKILMKVREELDDAPWSDSVQSDPQERERIQQWKRDHGEAVDGVAPSTVDNSTVNAPATKNAVLLDAEREDSKFDYRQSEEIFMRSEAESYEEMEDLDNETEDSPVITRGHHKAVLVTSESIKAKKVTKRNGESYIQKAYIKFIFAVDGANGKELETRAYTKDYESFKRQANAKYNGIFEYTPAKEARESLAGKEFDIWVKWNDVLKELQAEYYDKAAYAARKREQARVGFVGGGNSRPTENKATH